MINVTAEPERLQQDKATLCHNKPERQETDWPLQETGEGQLSKGQVAAIFQTFIAFAYTSSTHITAESHHKQVCGKWAFFCL